MDDPFQRNAYHWMAQVRREGYKPDPRRGNHSTEFDRWMREMDISVRQAALMLDIPEQRVRDLRSGWRGNRLNGGIVPSFATRYAMAALMAGMRPVVINCDCVDLRDRLAQSAHDAGLEPWPAGELLKHSPNRRPAGPLAGAGDVAFKIEKERRKRLDKTVPKARHKKNILVPRS